jgi:hypothetical protein
MSERLSIAPIIPIGIVFVKREKRLNRDEGDGKKDQRDWTRMKGIEEMGRKNKENEQG